MKRDAKAMRHRAEECRAMAERCLFPFTGYMLNELAARADREAEQHEKVVALERPRLKSKSG